MNVIESFFGLILLAMWVALGVLLLKAIVQLFLYLWAVI